MSGASLYGLKVGDRVQVFDINGPRMGQPKGGWDGTVVKIGRKLITVQYQHAPKQQFRLETGQANDDYGHAWVRTVEQAAENLRRSDLRERLRSGGVDLRHEDQFATETLEALVDVLEQAAGKSVGEGEQ